jgi:hypothetical protein
MKKKTFESIGEHLNVDWVLDGITGLVLILLDVGMRRKVHIN